MIIAQIVMEEKIKHAEEQLLLQESICPVSTVSFVTLETVFTPEPTTFPPDICQFISKCDFAQ
jgi:hypothetical protein